MVLAGGCRRRAGPRRPPGGRAAAGLVRGTTDRLSQPVVRADRLRVQARLQAVRGEREAGPTFERAIEALRELKSPYHLAVGLADYACYLAQQSEEGASTVLAGEAREIADRLGAAPLRDRIPPSADDDAAVHPPRESAEATALAES